MGRTGDGQQSRQEGALEPIMKRAGLASRPFRILPVMLRVTARRCK